MPMKSYLVSLALGLLCGVIYGLFNVRSPAPPVIALVGLLGILAGEQLPAFARKALSHDQRAITTSPAPPSETRHE